MIAFSDKEYTKFPLCVNKNFIIICGDFDLSYGGKSCVGLDAREGGRP